MTRSQYLRTSPHRRICIITGELAGPDFNGGIGTTNRAFAIFLRSLGYTVDIVYTRVEGGKPFSARHEFSDHVAAYRKLGIDLSFINNQGAWNDWLAKSYFSMQHLLSKKYDLVFFDDTHGAAYYPLLARHTGNQHLYNTTMCVTTHSASQWIYDLNETPVTTFEEARLMEMERRSIELADVLKAPSAYILRKYRAYGWTLPDNFVVLPNFTSNESRGAHAIRTTKVDEIVFFGRLESRKGLWMFCRALDRLKYGLVDKTVTFLGKPTVENGNSTDELILNNSAGWPFPIRLLGNFDQQQGLSYLKGHGRIALIVSPEDNSPSTILECLREGIPFLACSGSGGEELLDHASRNTNLFEPSVDALCSKLKEVLEHGGTTGRLSFDESRLRNSYTEWVEGLLKPIGTNVPMRAEEDLLPRPVIIVAVPPDFPISAAVAELLRTLQKFKGQVEIEVMTTEPEGFAKVIKGHGDDAPLNVNSFSDFKKIIRSLQYRESTIVGLCHITQIVTPTWIERAQSCFTTNETIFAVTGMASDGIGKRDPTHVSRAGSRKSVKRYLTGNTSALFPIVQETNGGFALLRSKPLEAIGDLSPFDRQYGRLKHMEHWIHEVLLTLWKNGYSFELIPDELVDNPPREPPAEVFRASGFIRSLAQTFCKCAPGTDQWVLARLAIDAGLERERMRTNKEYVRAVEERIGQSLDGIELELSPAQSLEQLAMVAHACVRPDLASYLSAAPVIRNGTLKFLDIADYMRSSATAVDLIEEIKANRFKKLNLDFDYSFQVRTDAKEFEMHANPSNKGTAAIEFPLLDLSRIDRFICTLHNHKSAPPIRCQIELIAPNKSRSSQQIWFANKELDGGEQSVWEIECPAEFRTNCKALLSIALADPEGTNVSSFVKWAGPIFIGRADGGNDD